MLRSAGFDLDKISVKLSSSSRERYTKGAEKLKVKRRIPDWKEDANKSFAKKWREFIECLKSRKMVSRRVALKDFLASEFY